MSSRTIGSLDHVGIAVRSIDSARVFVEDVLGATFRYMREDPTGSFRYAVFDLEGFTIELLDPVDPQGFLATFLEKRGEGVHHITLHAPELADKVAGLESKGIRVVDKRLQDPSFLEAFISPRSGCGVLWQLAETCPPLDNEPGEP